MKALFGVAMLLSTSAMADTLQTTIDEMDDRFFTAFNRCDIDTMRSMMTEDLEFYHDIGGKTDREQTLTTVTQNCERSLGLSRVLVKGSSRVFPIKDFGAIQHAKHQFCHPENGKMDCGVFEFVHVWKHTGDGWKLSRVVSYDH